MVTGPDKPNNNTAHDSSSSSHMHMLSHIIVTLCYIARGETWY